MKVRIIAAPGKLGQYMVQQALDKGCEVIGVCRAESVVKLERFGRRITVVPGATDDRDVSGGLSRVSRGAHCPDAVGSKSLRVGNGPGSA